MPRYFTHYWANETVEEYRRDGTEGEPFGRLLNNGFIRMGLTGDDYLYPVTVQDSELYVLGRMEVDGVRPYEAEGPDDPDQRWHEAAYARTSTPRRFGNKVPLSVVEQLECLSDGRPTRLTFVAPGKLDRQTLRIPRQLTPASAHLLDRQIEEYEAGPRTNVWVFQYVQWYDIERQVATESIVDSWKANQRRYDMQVGDRIYFRRTTGPQPSGITAVGSIVSAVRTTDIPDRPYEVDVMYEMRVEPSLGGDEIRHDDVLRHCYALEHGQSGTNFLLSPQEAERLEHLVAGRLAPFLSVKPGFSPDVKYDDRTRSLAAVVQRRGQTEFRNRLIDAYSGRCAVTGCDAVDALEAAHIQPYLGQHTNFVTNGLLLRADIHTLFDLGLLCIDTSTMTVLLASDLKATTYATLEGAPLRLPDNPACRPSTEALDRHRNLAQSDVSGK